MKRVFYVFVAVIIGMFVGGISLASADNPHPKPQQDTVYQCFNQQGAIEATRGALNHKPTCAHPWDAIDKWGADRV